MPRTRSRSSTTAVASAPMRQVLVGWNTVVAGRAREREQVGIARHLRAGRALLGDVAAHRRLRP